MKRVLKYLWIIPVLMVTIIFGALFLPNNEKDSMQEFQNFANSYLTLIQSQDEIKNFEGIKLSLKEDLSYKNGTYMISGENFSKITGSRLSYKDNGELEISIEDKIVTLYNNSNTIRLNTADIDISREQSSINNLSSMLPIEDIARNLGFTVKTNSTEMILTRPFITKRLIVESNSNLDNFGAIATAEGYKNIHIYQYDTESRTAAAYNYFSSLDTVTTVEVDSIVVPANTNEEDSVVAPLGLDDSFSYTSWGATAMSVAPYSQYLKDTIGVDNFPELIVAVLDTGIDSDHTWFSGRLAEGGANFSSSTNNTTVYEDVYGHGTHVSGIIADLTFSNVKILPVKVMNDNGYGFSSAIKLGIDYVNELKAGGTNIVAMNLSLGTTGEVGSINHSNFQTKIDTAYNNGIISVVAAGNDGIDCSTSTPANITSAITVSAVSTSGDVYFRPSWSNYGSYIDVCAPGGDIRSAAVGGGTKLDSGTSMAAPHIAAAIALLLTDTTKNYTLPQIETLLDNSAIDLGNTGWDQYYGEGLVSIRYANAEIIDEVTFSNTTTDHTTAFELTLTTNTPNARIFYTVNNDNPTLENASEYYSPLVIARTQKISAVAFVFDSVQTDKIIAYSKIRTVMYCFYGEDIDDAYTVDNNGRLLGYSGSFLDITVPKVVNGITVKTIAESAFEGTYIESITLPSTVTTIEKQAFANCHNLRAVYAPNVTEVGIYSFYGCQSLENLTDDYFPELETIDKYAFAHCYYLTNISLTKVKVVDYFSFYMGDQTGNPYITNINLPSAIIIGEEAFRNCTALSSVNLPSVQIISSNAFKNCDISGELYLPELKYLGTAAFYNNKNIRIVNMPKVMIVGSQAFYYFCTNITTINIPKAQIVGSNAFYNCSAVTSVNLSELHEAASDAFNGLKKLSTIELPKLQYAGKKAFYGLSSLESLNLPNIIKLSAYSFGNTSMISDIYLPSSLEYIDSLAFKGCANLCVFHVYYNTIAHDYVKANHYSSVNLATTNNEFTYTVNNNEVYITGYSGTITGELVIPSYINRLPVTKICANAFINNTNIYNINMSKLKTIEEYAFVGCTNLKSITLNSIETIERDAFKNCTALNEANIYSVKTIGNNAFYNCESLLSVKLSNNTTSIGEKSLGYITGDKIIPTFAIIGYSGTEAQRYANSLNIEFHSIFNNITSYYYNTYTNNGNTEITITLVDSYTTGSLILPSSYAGYTISKISTQAFMNCSFITGVQLPSTIKTIEQQAFYNCILLEEINLDYVTNLGTSAFYGCSSLTSVNLSHLTEIPESCFSSCERITTLNIPSVTKINSYAFKNCYDLHTVISPNLQHIEREAFDTCSNLQKIDTMNIVQLGTISNNTTYAGQVFANCEKLTTAYFPKLVRVAPAIFSSTLTKVVVGDAVEEIYGIPFLSPATIYGYAGSTIIKHAARNNITFQTIDKLSITEDIAESYQGYRFDDLTLSIETTGFEQTYQWYKTTSTIANGTEIENETNSTLNVDTDNVGTTKYFVVVTDWTGETVTSGLCTVNLFSTGDAYIISIGDTTNGSISHTGNNYVTSGDNFSITFTPNPGCYIDSITIDGTALTQSQIQSIISNNNTYTFDNVTADHTVEVTFVSANYTISVVQVANGYISQPKDSYAYGTSAYFDFTPILGYFVEYITIDGEIIKNTSNTTSYIVENISKNMTISAKFSPRTDIKYTVKHYQQSLNNSGILFVDGVFYNLKETDNLQGTTNEQTNAIVKYYIGFYSLNFENTTILPDGSTNINIFYNRETYSVNLFRGSGIANIIGSGDYLYGAEVTITAEVNPGYQFEKWTSGNETFYESSTEVTHTFIITNHDADFTATAIVAPTTPDTPGGDSGNTNPSTPDTPSQPEQGGNNNNNNNNTTTSNKGGGGAALGIILGVLGGAIVLVIVVVVKKTKNRRF